MFVEAEDLVKSLRIGVLDAHLASGSGNGSQLNHNMMIDEEKAGSRGGSGGASSVNSNVNEGALVKILESGQTRMLR